jgi:hypothetical protein
MRSYSIRGGEAPVVAREAGRRGGGDRELKKWRLADLGGGAWTCDLCIYRRVCGSCSCGGGIC